MDAERIFCIVARLMPFAVLIPKILQDLVAIAEQLRHHSDPAVRNCADKLHNPENLKNLPTNL